MNKIGLLIIVALLSGCMTVPPMKCEYKEGFMIEKVRTDLGPLYMCGKTENKENEEYPDCWCDVPDVCC